VAALSALIAPVLHVCEVRCIAEDALWLSMAQGRPGGSVAIHFTWKKQWGGEGGVASVLPALEAALAGFHARPHWGKLFTLPPKGASAAVGERLYGADTWRQWAALRKKMDPLGKFENEHLAQVFQY